MKPYLDKGKQIADDLLAEVERNRLNPWFARTFLEKLGPGMPMWVMEVNKYQAFPAAYNERVITMFGQLLALGTRSSGPARLSDKYLDDLLAPLDEHNGAGAESAWYLSHYLALGGPFGRDFLRKFGDKLDALERDGEKNYYSLARGMGHQWLTTTRVPNDPFESYFHALSFNPDAAQDFFVNPDRLHDYLSDRGKSLGEALVAATTVYRNAEQTGKRSADITADLVHTLGAALHDWPAENWRTDMLPSIANILNSYSDDMFYRARPVRLRRGRGVRGAAGPADFTVNDLRGTLAQVDHDTEAYKTIVQAQIAASRLFLADKLAEARDNSARRDRLLQTNARDYGLVLNQLFGVHLATQQEIGRLEDLADVDTAGRIDSTASSIFLITGVIPGPWTIFGTAGLFSAKAFIMPWVYEDITHNSAQTAMGSDAVKGIDQWYSANLAQMVVDMQNGGGFDGMPAEAGTWLDKHSYPPDARFVDGGKVIDWNAMSDAQKAAFVRWEADPEEQGVRVEMVHMFTALDAAGEKMGGD